MHVFYSLFIYPSLHLIVHRFVSWSVTGAVVLVLPSIITLFSSMLTFSVCPSAVVLPNSQLFPSNESISIINRSVIESVSLSDRPLVSWLNKENSSSTRERQSVIVTLTLLRLLVKRIKNHCASPVCSIALQGTVSRVSVQEGQAKSPLEKHHADAVVNFLLRIACQVTVGDRDGIFWSKL